jgi:hypothetical protein
MQVITRYVVDDRKKLQDASANLGRKYHRELQSILQPVLGAYGAYDANNGNAYLIRPLPNLTKTEKHALKLLYSTGVNEYEFLMLLRESGKKISCPVCGSLAGATLDHYLPKAAYPEYSVYTWNLIPACFDCNTHHNDTYAGAGISERMIHPYYDEFVARRLLSVEIIAPFWGAKLRLVPINVDGASRDVCEWHIENVINKTSALDRIISMWGNITRDKSSARAFFGRHEKIRNLKKAVKKKLREQDLLLGAENNWESALFHGISTDDKVLEWILIGCPRY